MFLHYMNSTRNNLVLALITLIIIGCNNNMSPKIPNDVKVHVEVSPIPTPVITVRHEIVISLEMEEVFKDECAALFDTHSQAYDDCVNKKKGDFIEQFMNLLNQANTQQTQGAQ